MTHQIHVSSQLLFASRSDVRSAAGAGVVPAPLALFAGWPAEAVAATAILYEAAARAARTRVEIDIARADAAIRN